MELFEAIKGRRSCRNFSSEPITEDIIMEIIEAGTWAPSPLNGQPWEFIVIEDNATKEMIYQEAERCRKWGEEASGWKWLGKYWEIPRRQGLMHILMRVVWVTNTPVPQLSKTCT
ncbi:MAG: nitroreductase family protein [Deltaproteobacteria bacterium]|nr:nitroreductase family protein [Deltaproteobacteria bacterium]